MSVTENLQSDIVRDGAERLTIRDIAKLTGVNIATIHRWRERGTRRAGRLEMLRIGGAWRTSRAALSDWLERCNSGERTDSPPASAPDRSAKVRQATEALSRAGF